MVGVRLGARRTRDDLTNDGVPAPSGPDGLDAETLTAILRDRAGASGWLAAIERAPVGAGIGLVADLARLELSWTGGSGPASVVLKYSAGPGASRTTGTALRMYEREAAFYRDLGGGPLWLAPACFSCGFDVRTHDHLVVMEDLREGRFGDSVAGVSPDDAHVVVRALADLHARSWDAGSRPGMAALPRVDDPDLMQIWTSAYPSWWAVAVEGVCSSFSTAVKAAFAALPEQLPALAAFLADGVLALGHGDVRADNIAFGVGERPLVLVDWQFADRARPGRDLGYFLTQSMQPADRRAHFDELVGAYHERLVASGVTIDRARLELELRAGALLCATYGIGAAGAVDQTNPRAGAVAAAQSGRAAAAIEDLDLPGVLGET